jgi:hypothetical protein
VCKYKIFYLRKKKRYFSEASSEHDVRIPGGEELHGITIVNLLLNLGNLAFLIKRIKSSLP